DGRRWLRGQRPYWQWVEFLERIEQDRRQRAVTGQGAWVDSGEIMVRDPLSQAFLAARIRAFPDTAYQLPLETAQRTLEYRPEAFAHRLAPRPLLLFHAGNDLL